MLQKTLQQATDPNRVWRPPARLDDTRYPALVPRHAPISKTPSWISDFNAKPRRGGAPPRRGFALNSGVPSHQGAPAPPCLVGLRRNLARESGAHTLRVFGGWAPADADDGARSLTQLSAPACRSTCALLTPAKGAPPLRCGSPWTLQRRPAPPPTSSWDPSSAPSGWSLTPPEPSLTPPKPSLTPPEPSPTRATPSLLRPSVAFGRSSEEGSHPSNLSEAVHT